jgi:hypothetical protein
VTTQPVFTERQFPLDEGFDPLPDGTPFAVLVEGWTDQSESPSQAIIRLNREVLDVRAQQVDAAFNELHGFTIEPPDQHGARDVRHTACEGKVVSIGSAARYGLGRLVDAARQHDCTAEARVYAVPEAKMMAQRAISLLRGADGQTTSAEYLRALTELVTDLAGLPPERKDEVAAFLWATAATHGDRPTI